MDGFDTSPGTVTRLLSELEQGDSRAIEVLFPIVYDELRTVARFHRRGWNGDNTLDTTALVHETYLKLAASERMSARNRVHFLRIASRAMRQILSNYARERHAAKRGGDSPHLPIATEGEARIIPDGEVDRPEILADLEDALQRLEKMDKRLSDVVECRFFGGLTIEDTATALGVSEATVKRDWALARSWLFRELTPR